MVKGVVVHYYIKHFLCQEQALFQKKLHLHAGKAWSSISTDCGTGIVTRSGTELRDERFHNPMMLTQGKCQQPITAMT